MNKIFNLGITDEVPDYLKGKVILTNQLAFILFCVGFVFGALTISFRAITVLTVIGLMLCLSALLINYFKFYNASRVLIAIMPAATLSLIHAVIVQSNDSLVISLSMGYISLSIIPFLIFDIREKKLMLPTIIIIWCVFMLQGQINQWINVPMDSSLFYEPLLVTATNLINVCIITFGLIFFQIKNYKAEKENTDLICQLQRQKEELANQRDFIKGQNEKIIFTNATLEEKVKKRTLELSEKNELLNNYFDNLPGVVYQGKVDGTFRPSFVSKGSLDVIGKTAAEIVDKGIFNTNIIEPDDLKKIANISKQARQNHELPIDYEHTYPLKTDNGRKWILDKGKITKAANGTLFYNGIWLDVTDKINTENKLRERDQQLKHLLESSEDMITLHDEKGTYLYYNGPKCYDVQPKELVGKTPYDLFNQESAEKLTAKIIEVFRTGMSLNFESQLDWQGSRKWFLEYIYPVKDQDGKIKSVAKICRDIDNQKIAEQRIKESEEKLSLIYNNVDVFMGMFKVQKDGTFILESINKPFLKQFQTISKKITEKDLIGIDLVKYYELVADYDKNKIAERVDLFNQIVKNKKSEYYEGKYTFTNDAVDPFFFSSSLAPILNHEGDCTHILFITEDISDRIKSANELKSSKEQLSLIYNNTQDFMGLFRIEGDTKFIVESVNATLGRLLKASGIKLTVDDFIEKDLDYLLKKPLGYSQELIEERIKFFQNIATEKKIVTYEGEFEIQSGTKTKLYFENTASPILDSNGNCTHILFVTKDISQQKKIELELKASESHSKTLFEHSPIIIWEEDFSAVKTCFETLKEKGISDFRAYFDQHPKELKQIASLIKVKDVNQKSVDFYGMESKEKHITELPVYLIEESWEVLKEEFIALAEGATTFESEIPINNQNGEIVYLIINLSIPPEYMNTWESVIVSFIDISDRKTTELLLEQSKIEIQNQLQRNKLILETTLDGYILTDTNAAIVDVNPAYCKMIGYTKKELLKMNVLDNLEIQKSKAENERRTQQLIKKGRISFETKHIRKDGGLIDLSCNLSLIQFNGEQMVAGFVRDITQQKKAQKELDYRYNFESLVTKISAKFINLPLDALEQGLNNTLKQICEFLDFDRAFLVLLSNENNDGSIHHEWFKPGIDSIKDVYQNVPFVDFPWFMNKIKNNELIIIKKPDNIPEEALPLKMDLQNRKIQSQIHVPLIVEDKVIGFIGYDALSPIEEWQKDLEALLRFSGIMITNVIQRIKGEKALKDSEEQLAMIYNNTNEFVGLFRVENGNKFYIESLNKTTIEAIKMVMPEFDLEQLIGMELAFFYKNVARYDDELVNKRIKDFEQLVKSKKEIHYQGIVPIPFKGNEFFAYDANLIPIINPKGDCNYLLFVTQDITQKKIAENAIVASEQRLATIYNNNMDFICLFKISPDNQYIIESINDPGMEFIKKYSGVKDNDKIIGLEAGQFFRVHLKEPEDRIKRRIKTIDQAIKEQKRIIFQNRLSQTLNNQEEAVFETVVSPILENGKCVQVLYVARNITENAKAKNQLIQSEKRMSSIFNGTKDQMAIFNIENDGKIVLEQVNDSFKDAWKKAGMDLSINRLYKKEIEYYHRLILKHPKRKTKEIRTLLKQVLVTKKTCTFEDEYQTPSGEKNYMDINISPILNENGNCEKLLFVARDITFKKKANEQMISKILETEDRERKRISKELHDSLGQNLTTASLNLNYLKNAITQIDDSYKIKFQKGIKFLNNAIDESRNIAHNLMPQSIVDFGYVMTIESLLEDLAGTVDTTFVFYNNLQKVRLAPYQELSLFRITQEAINNVLKHAEASKATLQLMKYTDAIILTIEDNGKGFEIENTLGHSFGLNSMSTRVSALSGTIDINSSPGKGTSITIEIPA